MNYINQLLNQIEKHIPFFENENKEISSQKVGWHLQHSLLVIQQITKTLYSSNPKEYIWKFNFLRLVIMGRNKIPRGKGKAPARVLPKEEITFTTLQDALAHAKQELLKINKLERNHYFTHPLFGDLNLKPAKKFIALHTQHHLDIVTDILVKCK